MGREPWLAVNLSLFWPGLGQWYLGRRRAAVSFMVLQLGLYALGISLLVSPTGSVIVAFACLAGALGVFLANLVHAHRIAVASNSPEFETERKGDRDAWLAVFLSRLLPGLGHAYVGRIGPAAAFLVGFVLLAVFVDLRGLSEILNALWFGLASYHAYHVAPVRREAGTSWIRRVAGAVVAFWILGALSIVAVRDSVLQAFRTPADSMSPSLRAGDRFLVRKWDRHQVQRGDIVVFRFPADRSKDFVERVIGMPGERIEIRDQTVWVNGTPLNEPYAVHTDPTVKPGGNEYRDNFGPYTVPKDQLFVLGDNRDNSNDSRFWGPLPIRDVKGVAYRIYWPPSRAGPIRSPSPGARSEPTTSARAGQTS